MNTFLFATQNSHKAVEVQEMLGDLGIALKTLKDYPAVMAPEEDAPTIEGNALKKAREAFRLTGLPTFADDTALEVGYLNGQPGVYSSRYAGPGATYAENCKKLLDTLRGVPPRRRGARFRCVIAFLQAPGKELLFEGVCNGVITEAPRGLNGFGYDPVFQPGGYSQTFGQIDAGLKNSISHRARAVAELRKAIRPALSLQR